MTYENQELEDLEVQDEKLPPPRFDDETTLLSARPVVPLDRVRVYARSKRLIRFVFALFTAGLLGAMTAILLSNWNEVRSINVEESGATNVMSEVPQPKPTVTKEVNEMAPQEHKESEADEEVRRQVERDREARERREEKHARIREQQREARERQREARRRQREEREETNDDLYRIREIFEGRPRPDR